MPASGRGSASLSLGDFGDLDGEAIVLLVLALAVIAAIFVASGYLVPTDLFPPGARAVVELLPFRYQLAFPVELMIGRYDAALGQALVPLGIQAAWVLLAGGVAHLVWERGVRRFGAFGG